VALLTATTKTGSFDKCSFQTDFTWLVVQDIEWAAHDLDAAVISSAILFSSPQLCMVNAAQCSGGYNSACWKPLTTSVELRQR
jgi:hypothetical protein